VSAEDRDSAYEDVAPESALPAGELLGVTLSDGSSVCLYNDRGAIGALGGVCTHGQFAMSDGVLIGDGTIECVWHGARFDCRTGAARRHPASGALPVYDVRIESGRILVGPRVRAQQETAQ
jgi:3-phenylpropionate/trans-cinnamate dioxygenase ferredoxin component